jgi:hypothetical protein
MPVLYAMDSPQAFVRPPDRVIMIAKQQWKRLREGERDRCASGSSRQVNEEEA